MFIQRIWEKVASCKGEWVIWDAGNEFWEMKDDVIRHFSIVSRVKDETTIVETVQLLNDSPIPLEAIRQEVRCWKVNEKVLPSVGMRAQIPQPSRQSPSRDYPSRQMPSRQMLHSKQMPSGQMPSRQMPQKRVSQPLRQGPAFLPDTPEDVSEHPPPPSQYHEQLLQKNTKPMSPMKAIEKEDTSEGSLPMCVPETLAPTSLEEQSKQSSYTPPNNIWSSLSQWIPPSALFQPSLHHQAFLELSGTQDRSYPEKKDSEMPSQKKEVRPQYVRHSQHSNPYRPKISGPSKQVSTGPLFI